MQTLKESFLAQLRGQFGEGFFTQKSEELKIYGRDWTRVFEPSPSAVVFPSTTEEVSRFLRLCSEYQIRVVPSGGRTGLAAGAVAASGEVVLSLQRMNQMGPVDVLAHTLRAQAGAITEHVHQHCLTQGLIWPVDFASKGSSQIGGNIATNAGGVKVIRYGLTRNWVLGLQVVTMDGSILELNGALEKNNTGMDLRQFFIGSEGTLGVITEATLKLTRVPGELAVFFFALDGIQDVLQLFKAARTGPFQIMAFEFLTQNCLQLVAQTRGVASPFSHDHPTYVLLEVEKSNSFGALEGLDYWLESLFHGKLVRDGVLAQSSREAKELWSFREGISESLAHRGFVHKNDIALPISKLSAFVDELYRLLDERGNRTDVYLFGHIGDGNLHVNTMKPQSMSQAEFLESCERSDESLFQLIKRFDGSISAEHGIGLLKKKALHFSRSEAELALMRGMKRVFDPQCLLNEGKIF
jgi:FAD/FMN-containing dehydrogenase